jgi:D-alanine-D-alanine ligase-like ATP-grasp enzyme
MLRARLTQRVHETEAQLSLARSLGLRHSMRRWHADRAHGRRLPERRSTFTQTIWAEAAQELGLEFQQLSPRLFRFRKDHVVVHVLGQRTPFADPVSIEVASEKHLAYDLFAEAGVPIPPHVVVAARDYNGARAFLETGGVPCVVKPIHGGGGGQGVTAAVTTAKQLARAMRRAALTSRDLLVERQVAGEHYRMLLLDGDVLDVLRRGRPQVVGDGVSTIEELMFFEYERRISTTGAADGLKPFAADLDCLFTLEQAGLHLHAVLGAGEAATVKSVTNISGSRECVTFRGAVSRRLIAEAGAAAAAVGVRLAGVDIVTPDPSVSLVEGGGVALEVNPIPGLVHHYNVADSGAATRVAIPILSALLNEARASPRPKPTEDVT